MPKRERKFVLRTAKNDQPFIQLVGGNGEILMFSETYSSNQALMASLEKLKGTSFPDKVVDLRDIKK
jgi:uncharacterized protein YegP (UPF0339 family)